MVQLVSIPDAFEELCEECFYKCENLSRVTFCESPSLRLIWHGAFFGSCLTETHTPNGVEELCEAVKIMPDGE